MLVTLPNRPFLSLTGDVYTQLHGTLYSTPLQLPAIDEEMERLEKGSEYYNLTSMVDSGDLGFAPVALREDGQLVLVAPDTEYSDVLCAHYDLNYFFGSSLGKCPYLTLLFY